MSWEVSKTFKLKQYAKLQTQFKKWILSGREFKPIDIQLGGGVTNVTISEPSGEGEREQKMQSIWKKAVERDYKYIRKDHMDIRRISLHNKFRHQYEGGKINHDSIVNRDPRK